MTASSSGLLKDDGDRRTLSRSLLSTNMSCSRAANFKKKKKKDRRSFSKVSVGQRAVTFE